MEYLSISSSNVRDHESIEISIVEFSSSISNNQ